MARLGIGLMWLLHWLPLPLQGLVGSLLGRLLLVVNKERRRITRTNLRLCFPALNEAAQKALLRRHFAVFAQSALERGILWWASAARIRRLVRLEGMEHLDALRGTPVILLAPHFVGLDMGWSRLCLERDMVTMYARVKSPAFNRRVRAGRRRFGRQRLVSRQEGLRQVIAELRAGVPFYYLPDMDYGARDAVFAPFFGVQAATLTAVARLAKLSGAKVLPVVTHRAARGYVTNIGAPWQNFPSGDTEADAARMNGEIERAIVAADAAQYLWSHKRFKTRPPGEKAVY
ncbi:MAG: lipid A biosynthesis acyltransferase [Rhodocyclaceae bacterium]|jgi:KDO2-lipid IV(A) lauroyltransferase|nr:lipid A biosynthesis acyltransferase [Rhodocyclaceae bacterium]